MSPHEQLDREESELLRMIGRAGRGNSLDLYIMTMEHLRIEWAKLDKRRLSLLKSAENKSQGSLDGE